MTTRKKEKRKTTRLRSRLIVLTAGLLLGLNGTMEMARAGWVDDWVDQKTENSPGYFEGQKRGYYNGGGFSARWNLQNDYLWSVTPPKLKTGCGGIDAFMGGFSFLDTEYMVQKLQRIMSAAPAAAFDIALKTLVPQVSETIKSLEGMADKLNSIQLDECKSARALVATIATPGTGEGKRGELAAIQADWWQSTGAGDLWTKFNDDRKAAGGQPDATVTAKSMEGCGPDFRAVFAGGSLIANAGAKLGLTNASYLQLIRGYTGDVFIQAPNPAMNIAAYKIAYDPPCDQNQAIKSLLDGTAQGKETNGGCTTITDANRDLRQYVRTRMQTIVGQYRSKGALDAASTAFVNSSPLAIGVVLKTAIEANQEDAVISQLSDITAKAYAYAMLSDLYAKTGAITQTARAVMTAQNEAVSGKEPHTCQVANVDDALQMVSSIESRLVTLMEQARGEYVASATELNTVYQFVDKQKQFNEQANQILSEKFGRGVTDRAMNGG